MATLLPGNIIYSGPASYSETKDYRSLGHFITEKLKSNGDKVIMIDGLKDQQYTARAIHQSVVRLAYALQKLGIKSGDVVGIYSENRFEWAVAFIATFLLNATAAPLNPTYTDREINHALNLSKPKLIFASKFTLESIMKVTKKNNIIKHVIMFDLTRSNSKMHAYNELMADQSIATHADFFCNFANKQEDVAVIVCSSGTTGQPKGVQLTQQNILSSLDASITEFPALPLNDFKILSVLPWFHVFGCMTLINASVMCTTFVFLPKFEPHSFLSSIQKYRISLAFLVPPLMVFLAKHSLVDKYDLSSLELLGCGAAPLSKDTVDLVKKRLGVRMIFQAYGLSETTRGITTQNVSFCKPGSVGSLKIGLYAKVIDTETRKALGPNQLGELCFKGDYIMKGYIGDKNSTNTIIRDGWLHTGDIGYYDENFEFFIVDRIKELIKYKAFQVPPAEIEALLLNYSKIKDAAVIGKPDESAGELPLAFIVKQPNVELTESEVIKFVADRTSPAKHLHGGVIFIDEIPKNPSGKILRRVLRDMITKKPKSKL